MAKSTEELVLEKLDRLLRILTVDVTKGMKQNQQIALLDRAGFEPREIADLLGTTRNTVNVALTNLRKAETKKGKGARSKKA